MMICCYLNTLNKCTTTKASDFDALHHMIVCFLSFTQADMTTYVTTYIHTYTYVICVAFAVSNENDLIPPFLPVSGTPKPARLLGHRSVWLSDSDCDGQ